jgi:hypothetical protein
MSVATCAMEVTLSKVPRRRLHCGSERANLFFTRVLSRIGCMSNCPCLESRKAAGFCLVSECIRKRRAMPNFSTNVNLVLSYRLLYGYRNRRTNYHMNSRMNSHMVIGIVVPTI